MTEPELTEAVKQGAIRLATAELQDMFPSGKAVRAWADKNALKLTVHKGFVDIRASDRPASKTTVAEEVEKVANSVKERLLNEWR